MKNLFLILPLVFLFIPLSNLEAQNYFSLIELLEFSNYQTFNQFDNKVRTFGYDYAGSHKYISKECTEYSFFKNHNIKGKSFTSSIYYEDWGNGRALIRFRTRFEGFYTYIKNQITSKGFNETGFESNGTALTFSYESKSYNLVLYSNNSYNTVEVWRKLKK